MTLEEARNHIRDAVIYDDGYSIPEHGEIVRVNQQYVFVR